MTVGSSSSSSSSSSSRRTRRRRLSMILLGCGLVLFRIQEASAFAPPAAPSRGILRRTGDDTAATRRTMAIPPVPSSSSWRFLRLQAQLKEDEEVVATITATTDEETSSNDTNELDRILTSDEAVSGAGGGPSRLRQAVTFLRQHPEYKLSKQNWKDIFITIEEATANADENTVDPNGASSGNTDFPFFSPSRQDMTDMYKILNERGDLQLFGAISTKQPPAISENSHDISPKLLQEILDLPMSSLTPAPTNSLLLAGFVVATLEGLLSVYTGISLNAIVLCTLLIVFMDRLFLNGAGFESFLKLFSPGMQNKILKHEAGHFLLAYLLGCPVEGIVLSAWAALRDVRFGQRQVSAGTSFFDPILSQQINNQHQITRSSLDRYSMIVMAGIAAEANAFGQADGGASDELALVSFLSRLQWPQDKIRNQARWGAMQSVLTIRQYKDAYDALVDALERGGTLGDCIFAIEKAARDHDLPTAENRQPVGHIERGVGGDTRWVPNDNDAFLTMTAAQDGAQQSSTTPVASSVAQEPAVRSDEQESSLQALENYKSQVQRKLEEVEEKLKGLD